MPTSRSAITPGLNLLMTRNAPHRLGALLLLAATVACPSDSKEVSGASETGQATTGGSDAQRLLAFDPLSLPSSRAEITGMKFLPGESEFVLLGKDGFLWHYGLEGDTVSELGTVTIEGTFIESDCGIISLAFDPDFATNRLFYVGRCVSQTDSVIERYVWNTSDYAAIGTSGTEVLRLGDENATRPWHNVGAIGFDDDGVMWALFGEKKIAANAQDTTNSLGSLVRIMPRRDLSQTGYDPLPDRPFPESDAFAYGFRSPWTGTLDERGFYWVGDVGADDFEEIDVVTEVGQNFGWSLSEGPCEGDCEGLAQPVIAIEHGIDKYVTENPDAVPVQSRVIFVAVSYRDEGNDRYDGLLTGRTVVGEACTGSLRLLEVDDDGALTLDRHVGHLPSAHAWAQAPDGYVYAVQNGGCGAGNISDADSTLLRARLDEG